MKYLGDWNKGYLLNGRHVISANHEIYFELSVSICWSLKYTKNKKENYKRFVFKVYVQIIQKTEKNVAQQYMSDYVTYPTNIDLFKVNNGNTRKSCGIFSKLTTKTPERRRRRSGVFIVNFENISHLFLVFLLLTLNK